MRRADVPIYAKVSLAPGLVLIVLFLLSLVSIQMLDAGKGRLDSISLHAFPRPRSPLWRKSVPSSARWTRSPARLPPRSSSRRPRPANWLPTSKRWPAPQIRPRMPWKTLPASPTGPATSSREVQEAADAIGQEADKLLSEVDEFLVALCDETGDKRGYERVPGQGASVLLRIPGQAPARFVLRDISRGGAALL
jgi:hypothetical protein